jgi:hypothetical protein
MKHAMLGSLLVFVIAGCATGRNVSDDTNEDSPKINLELYLVDGSRIIGVPKIEAVPLETSYAKISIPLAKIQSIKMNKDHETASLDLRDGDKLKGVVSLDPIKLETVFGSIKIDMKHIQKMEIMLCGRAGQNGLVLWNRLDSENDVWNSRVGPGGKLNAGRFVEGRFGKGVELNMQEQFGVTFPSEIVSDSGGCIEFWAKLVSFPMEVRQPGGTWPGLIAVGSQSNSQGFILSFCSNDGAANGGICGRIADLGSAGTGAFGHWTYARALNSEESYAWHHYALVWAAEGISGVDNGKRKLAVYIDGKLNTGSWGGDVSNKLVIPKDGHLGLVSHQGATTGSIVFDNLKVWNYAKTDFSDRNNE